MGGYAKTLMEEAARWLAINPNPTAERVRVPNDIDRKHARLEAMVVQAAQLGEPLPQSEIDGMRKCVADMRRTEAQLEEIANLIVAEGHTRCPNSGRVRDGELCRWIVPWARDGYNTMTLTPDFAAAMTMTDPAEVDFDRIRLPFRALLLLIPDQFVRDEAGGSFTKVHLTDLAFVSTLNSEGKLVVSELPSLDIRATDGNFWIATTVQWKALKEEGIAALDMLDVATCDEQDSEQSLLNTLAILRRIVFGTLAYVSAVKGAAVERDPQRKPKRGADRPRVRHWDVGRDVRIDPRLVHAARQGLHEVAFRLKHKHIVRGHYRNQACGAGLRDRKTIWISPFWKGPEDGAALVHTYKPAIAPSAS